MVDLRRLFPEFDKLVTREGKGGTMGRVLSYPHLTEVTRNPRESRAGVEKSWVLWFPGRDEAYVQYDMLGRAVRREGNVTLGGTNHMARETQMQEGKERRGGRTFAKLTGNGFRTPNLMHPDELP